MTPDIMVHVFDRRTGLNLLRGEFDVVDKQFQDGELLCFVADSIDGRRLSIQIRSTVVEEVPPPPAELTLISMMSVERSAKVVGERAPSA